MAVANIGGGPTTTALVAVTFLVASVVSWSGTGTPAGFVEVRGENAGCVGLGLSHGEWSTDTSGCLVDAKDEDDRDASWDGPAAGCFSYDDEFNDEFNDEPPALWRFALDLKRRCGLHTETEQWNAFVGKKVTVVGDSVARHVYASVLRLAAVDGDAFYLSTKEKHRDWRHALRGDGVAEFVWAPFIVNVTRVIEMILQSSDNEKPDLLVMGAALWDALHARDVARYQSEIAKLATVFSQNAKETFGKQKKHLKMFWLTVTPVDVSKLTDGAKIDAMSFGKLKQYDDAAKGADGFLADAGDGRKSKKKKNGFLLPVDVGALATGCADLGFQKSNKNCTRDGIHYRAVVYDAAVQAIGNAVRLVG